MSLAGTRSGAEIGTAILPGLGTGIGAGLGALFGGSGDPGGNGISNYATFGKSGETTGGVMTVGDKQLHFNDPGLLDPHELNPYASDVMDLYRDQYRNLHQQQQQFQNSLAGSAFNPDMYKHMQDVQQAQMTTALGNQYSAAGLSGSSAAMGGMASAIQNNQMNWMNRQQGDQLKALQGNLAFNNGLSGLAGNMYNDTMGIQNQYGNFQDAYNQSVLGQYGMEQQQDMQNKQFWGSILTAGLAGGGSVAGGAMGGGHTGGPDTFGSDGGSQDTGYSYPAGASDFSGGSYGGTQAGNKSSLAGMMSMAAMFA